MVYIDGVKYACEACVKGHRSSSCSHTQRPLFEIKKKGRPVTQCEHCRQLRKTKQVHVKCSCESGAATADAADTKDGRGKGKRKLPSSAAFPDGLKGDFASASTSTSASPSPVPQRKPKVEPTCPCGSTGECACATPVPKPRASSSSSASSGPATPPPPASSCCSGKGKPARLPGDVAHPEPQPLAEALAPALEYAPPFVPQTRELYAPPPPLAYEFTWPPGTGLGVCGCGATCACPGCAEHSDPSTVLSSSETCPYSCSTCSHCNGFGFAPVPESFPIPAQDPAWPDFPAWVPPPAAPASPAVSDCCGGACKCTVACACADGCCGCCFGCACSSDAEGSACDPDPLELGGPRVGFAVSGERASCGTRKRGGDAGAADADGRERKRRRVERAGAGGESADVGVGVSAADVHSPYRAIAETPTLFPFASSPNSGASVDHWSTAHGFH